MYHRPFRVAFLCSVLLFLTEGCTTGNTASPLPKKRYERTLVNPHSPLLDLLQKTDKPIKNRSAFYPLARPDDAFVARLYLIDHAKSSLDVQYYIYENDITGKIFSAHLLKAAQRGVKVRILLDDLSTAGKDHALALLAHHPNIRLKLFNPNHLRRSFRNLALLFDVNTLGKRMHNKLLMADGVSAIVGGRNIGDVYFAPATETIFVDFDMIVIGSVLPELREEFDTYWNSESAVPSHKLLSYNAKKITQYYRENIGDLSNLLENFSKSKLGTYFAKAPLNKKLHRHTLTLYVAQKTSLYYDDPKKVVSSESKTEYHITPQIRKDLTGVKQEVLLISPYFIPSEEMLQQLQLLRKHHVKVTVITNSLASTDVFAVYGGYRNSIKALLDAGIALYELKPDAIGYLTKHSKRKKMLRTSLHTKMIVIDTDRLIIGSANLDPRSDKLNTEIMMMITSQKLASEAKESIKTLMKRQVLYRVGWGKLPKDPKNRWHQPTGPIWITEENGKEKYYFYPPNAGFFKSIGADFISLLPVKGYL